MELKVGNKLKKIRELKNLSQEHLAQSLKMSQTNYSKLERDEVEMSISRLAEIGKLFGMKVEDIIAFDEKFMFTAYDHGQAAYTIHNNQVANEQIKTLYEDKIKLLEEIIKMKDEELKRFK